MCTRRVMMAAGPEVAHQYLETRSELFGLIPGLMTARANYEAAAADVDSKAEDLLELWYSWFARVMYISVLLDLLDDLRLTIVNAYLASNGVPTPFVTTTVEVVEIGIEMVGFDDGGYGYVTIGGQVTPLEDFDLSTVATGRGPRSSFVGSPAASWGDENLPPRVDGKY